MNQEKIDEILKLHKKWLNDESNSICADLRGADLCGVELRRANLDFSCLPLWCGGLGIHIDDRLAVQILYHLIFNIQFSKNVSDEIKKYF